jgi:hypothetical protein
VIRPRDKRGGARAGGDITDRGKPSHVLPSIDAYRQLTGRRRSIVEALAMPCLCDIDLDALARPRDPPRAADLS